MTSLIRCHDCRAPLAHITHRFIQHPESVRIIADTIDAHRKACPVGALKDVHAVWSASPLTIRNRIERALRHNGELR